MRFWHQNFSFRCCVLFTECIKVLCYQWLRSLKTAQVDLGQAGIAKLYIVGIDMTGTYDLYFSAPWWWLGGLLVIPVLWLGLRSLGSLGRGRKIAVLIFRSLLILVLVGLLARPNIAKRDRHLSLMIVLDRSLSVPGDLQKKALDYLQKAVKHKPAGDKIAVIDVAERASISTLPSTATLIHKRNTTLTGRQSNLADGVQMAMAVTPPDTANRILLVSDGNQTEGDLKEAARIAAANGIPIDVLPLRYQYKHEVIFRRLAVPPHARRGQTIALRFILNSTSRASGKLYLKLNGKTVDLDPSSDKVAVDVQLKVGTNVKTVSLPVSDSGMYKFEAEFVPDNSDEDRIVQNNRVSGMTYVSGPGHVLVVDTGGKSGAGNMSPGRLLANVMQKGDINVHYCLADDFPQDLSELVGVDAIVLVNTDNSSFSYQQQEMMCRYVNDLGGGLVMTGGDKALGAGGWIGSPVARILPVDLEPPQKRQLPKGALVLIMHACEMPQGNLWGKRVAIAAVKTLSRLDYAGILSYSWNGGDASWVYPFSQVGNKNAVVTAIKKMQMGDMPDFRPHLQAAYNKLSKCNAAQKHIIIISDGDPQGPSLTLLNKMKQAGITCSGVAVNPHSPVDVQSLIRIAQLTGGRFYNVRNPQMLPRIFIKEAQVVRRSLIVEKTFKPSLVNSLTDITRGLGAVPRLDGYVLTGPREGLSQIIYTSPEADPILAICQSGLGRCVVFTSSVDSRWASKWLRWSGFDSFWEQVVRWVAKPGQDSGCEVFTDVQGHNVSVSVQGTEVKGRQVGISDVEAVVVAPDISVHRLQLRQNGPGLYKGNFEVGQSGSYILNLRYHKSGHPDRTYNSQSVINVPFAPEFRDLSDNFPLLKKVANITGGRVIGANPDEANLFDYDKVKFPFTSRPLTKSLLLILIVVLLLDVAVRRIAVDFAAMYRRGVGWAARLRRSGRGAETDLQRLKKARSRAKQRYESKSESSSGSIVGGATDGMRYVKGYDEYEEHEGRVSKKSAAKRYSYDESKQGDIDDIVSVAADSAGRDGGVTDGETARSRGEAGSKIRNDTAGEGRTAGQSGTNGDSYIDKLLKAKRKSNGNDNDK